MNTKECILYLESIKMDQMNNKLHIKKIDGIIELLEEDEERGRILMTPRDFYNRSEYVDKLKRGEKYEEMWEDLKSIIATQKDIYIPEEYRSYQGGSLEYLIKKVEQKYFPKPQKTVLILEIESRNIENSLKEIYSFINSANGGAVEEFHGHITLTGIKDAQER